MFLYMFLQTGASVLGLGDGLTKTVMVVGSLVVLTVAGWAEKYEKIDEIVIRNAI